MQDHQAAHPGPPHRAGDDGAADAPAPAASERAADDSAPSAASGHGSTVSVSSDRVRPGPSAPDPLPVGDPAPGPAAARVGGPRRRGLTSLLRRRAVFLPEERVDPPADAEAVAETSATATLRSPVATGFLLAVGVFLALLIVGILQTSSQLLIWIGAALFIALGLDPVVRRIERWGAPRWVGVLAAALGMAAVVGAFVSLLVPTAIQQSTQLADGLPRTVEDLMATEWFQALDAQLHIQHAVRDRLSGLTADGDAVTELFGGLVGIGQSVMNGLFSVLVVVVLSLYFLASLPHMKYWLYRLAPRSKRRRVEALGEEITSSVGHYVMGQTVVAVLNGTVAFIALWIAGTPFAALLAFVAGALAFVPLVGAMIGGVLLTALSLLTDWTSAATFAAIYFVYLQIEAYIVSPRVMARAVAVPAAVGVIAVIAGGTLLGVLGALMAIPTAAAVMLIFREVFIPRQDAR